MRAGVGHVLLAGAGPGDPGLITVAAAGALAQADVVLYDALVSPQLLEHSRPGAELIPVGKRAGQHSASQDEINALLVRYGREGKRVVRLKGGDPFVFGRGGEEAIALGEAGIPFSVAPGVTSAVAVPAAAGIPVTHRGISTNFAVVTGTEGGDRDTTDWAALARMDTLVVLMGGARLGEIAARLVAEGKSPDTPAAAIANGTLAGQETVVATLSTIGEAAAALPTPVITVVGEVVRLRERVDWMPMLPLAGRRVVVTRSRTQASRLAAMLVFCGARVLETPVLEIRPRPDNIVADERAGSRWDWIVFTSQNAVEVFFQALAENGRDARTLGTTKVAVIGEATRDAAASKGIVADFMPSNATGAYLSMELPAVSGARIYLPASSLTDSKLADGLRSRGGHVEQVVAYETTPLPLSDGEMAEITTADAITFTSASTARFLAKSLGERMPSASTRLVSIGPQTSVAVRESFGRIDAEAVQPSLESLVSAVEGLFR